MFGPTLFRQPFRTGAQTVYLEKSSSLRALFLFQLWYRSTIVSVVM